MKTAFVIRTCTTETNKSYFNAVIMHLYIQIDNIQINVTTLREFSGNHDATRRDMVVWTNVVRTKAQNFNVIRSIRHLFLLKKRRKKKTLHCHSWNNTNYLFVKFVPFEN